MQLGTPIICFKRMYRHREEQKDGSVYITWEKQEFHHWKMKPIHGFFMGYRYFQNGVYNPPCSNDESGVWEQKQIVKVALATKSLYQTTFPVSIDDMYFELLGINHKKFQFITKIQQRYIRTRNQAKK